MDKEIRKYSCDHCDESFETSTRFEDADLMRALKNAGRKDNSSHAYNLLELYDEAGKLRMPLCMECSVSALVKQEKELEELENENLAYQLGFEDLDDSKGLYPYQRQSIQEQVDDLNKEESDLEQELMLLTAQESSLYEALESEIQQKRSLIDEGDKLLRDANGYRRQQLEYIDTLLSNNIRANYYKSAINKLSDKDLVDKLIKLYPEPVTLKKEDGEVENIVL